MIRRMLALALLVVVVQVAHAAALSPSQGDDASAPDTADALIDLNTATASDFAQLPGIGPTRAQAIVDEREKRKFRRVEDILRVPGIGRKTFARIRGLIRVQ
ncbi:MAG: ComEA family DNA-binding protein [Polyangiales bacterium]